jgi:hypothetical protein
MTVVTSGACLGLLSINENEDTLKKHAYWRPLAQPIQLGEAQQAAAMARRWRADRLIRLHGSSEFTYE